MVVRYHKAVDTTQDIDMISAGQAPAPSKFREHVFDYPDGVRMIISIDKMNNEVFLHVSASCSGEYIAKFHVKDIKDFFIEFAKEVERRLAELRGCEIPKLVESFISNSGIVHLVFSGTDEQLRVAAL